MMTVSEPLQPYYDAWLYADFDRALFTDDFSYSDPLIQCESVDEFMELTELLSNVVEVDKIEIVHEFFNETTHTACVVFDFVTSRPQALTTRIAEVIEINDGKIRSAARYYDPRGWVEVMG